MVAELLPGFASDAQRALQFVRSTPGIGTALVGMKSTAHVEENAAVARRPPTPWSDFQRLFSAADRKSTRLNSSHSQISYAVFCLKKKKEPHDNQVVEPIETV